MQQEITQTKQELLDLLVLKDNHLKYNKIESMYPDEGRLKRDLYRKHIEVFAAGMRFRERGVIAANRVGKTTLAAYEVVCHLTGVYPWWWPGRKYLLAGDWICANTTHKQVRNVQQKILLGNIDDIGSGLVPKQNIVSHSRKANVPDAIEIVRIKHSSGDISQCYFGCYEQGGGEFQGITAQGGWLDEDPGNSGVYSEILTRTMNNTEPGMILCTFTPLLGLSDTVLSYMPGGLMPYGGVDSKTPSKWACTIEWDDVPHLSEQDKRELLSSYAPHERLARSKGIPGAGSGRIYTYPEEVITCPRFQIPEWWPKAYGLDVGWSKLESGGKTAAIWGAQNPDTGIIYLYAEYYSGYEIPAVHAANIKSKGTWIPGVIDIASQGVPAEDGKMLWQFYRDEGLDIDLCERVGEAGLAKVSQLMATGQLYVFEDLTNWRAEYRLYHRDEKEKIVKKHDHLMDATKYLVWGGLRRMIVKPTPNEYNSNYAYYSDVGRNEYTGY